MAATIPENAVLSSSSPADGPDEPSSPVTRTTSQATSGRARGVSGSSGPGRRASLSERFMESAPPSGFMSGLGETAANIPTIGQIRRGSFGVSGWEGEGQRRNSMTIQSMEGDDATPPSRLQYTRTNSAKSPVEIARSQQTSHPLAETAEDDEDGLPSNIFGRGEMSNQAYVRGPKETRKVPDVDDDEVDPLEEDLNPKPVKSNKINRMFGDEAPAAGPSSTTTTDPIPSMKPVPNEDGIYPNGYRFPPKHTKGQATVIGLKAAWKFLITPVGFLIVLYGLNVVAWGGMLFLLLCGAAPAMCYPEQYPGQKLCNDINSPRRIWIEWDSQILNALFCVTGFGLAPWRFRDFYFLMRYRIWKRQDALRKLAGIHNGWFRLQGSDGIPAVTSWPYDDMSTEKDNPALCLPLSKSPPDPLTGVRAPPTKMWKMDYVVWAFVANTALQIVLSFFMWHFNRFLRPSWSTGLFVALACIVAALGGGMQFSQGKKVKKVEGVPVGSDEIAREQRDFEKAQRQFNDSPLNEETTINREEKKGGV
ncbi:hypothetical protein MMC09_001849 [Bachmanniomyces sp. S44760]|nr:hypothetical protein [Bachmanniomyces sp. S44760]